MNGLRQGVVAVMTEKASSTCVQAEKKNAIEGGVGGVKGVEKVVHSQSAKYNSAEVVRRRENMGGKKSLRQTDTEGYDDYILLRKRHAKPKN
jgi:hypothetical protein